MAVEELDFTGVESRGGAPTRVTEGMYPLRIKKCDQNVKSKNGNKMWVFDMEIVEGPDKGKVIRERCTLTQAALFRLRALIEAAGFKVPTKKLKVDPQKQLVGKTIGALVKDGEPYGKTNTISSEIAYYVDLADVAKDPAWANATDTFASTEEDEDEDDDEGDADLDDLLAEGVEDDEEEDDEEEEDEPTDEDEEEGYTEEELEGMERADLLKAAKELGVPRKKGKRNATYIREILEAQDAGGDDEDEEDDIEGEDTDGDDGEFSLDDLS